MRGRSAPRWGRALLVATALAAAAAWAADPATSAPGAPGAPGTPGATGPTSALPAAPSPAADAEAKRRAHALFDEYWETTAREFPEWATWRGDHRFDDRWTDASPQARARRDALERDWLERARAIDRGRLDAVDRVSIELFAYERAERVAEQAFAGWRTMTLASQGGFHTELFDLFAAMPMDDAAQVRRWLARLRALPARVDQELHWLREGLALGWVPSRPVLKRVIDQLDAQLARAGADSPFAEPLQRLGSGIAPGDVAAIRSQALALIDRDVRPAWQRLRDFVAGPYLSAAPPDGALSGYPDGARIYAWQVAVHTTLPVSAREWHDTGLREVARLQREIDRARADAGFDGSTAAWIEQLNTDPRHFAPSADALLAGYREVAKRVDPELPKLFAELPRLPYGVRPMPAHRGADTADYYSGPALDGSRAGWFNVNVQNWRRHPTWSMEALLAHEAVPGHHLQTARAVELGALPAFRRDAEFTAYVEGWALYAETLGFDLGLYRDPASRFGYLQMQIFRAARLVVDTGLHAFGWTREQAVDVLQAASRFDRDFCAAEVDRYLSWPGQALAYMAGQLKIVELRDRARAALGPKFDLRRFHNVLLDQSALPLPVLEAIVDDWIAAQKAR